LAQTLVPVEKLFLNCSARNFLCKLLDIRSPKTPKFMEITALVPFSTDTPVYSNQLRQRAGTLLSRKTKRSVDDAVLAQNVLTLVSREEWELQTGHP
jgi:hypothetical protein